MIYLTSNSKDGRHDEVKDVLCSAGIELYDYRDHGRPSDAEDYTDDPEDRLVLVRDQNALTCCTGLVLILPGGRGSHLEAGYMAGTGKPVFVLATIPEGKPELMYGLAQQRDHGGYYKSLGTLIVAVALSEKRY